MDVSQRNKDTWRYNGILTDIFGEQGVGKSVDWTSSYDQAVASDAAPYASNSGKLPHCSPRAGHRPPSEAQDLLPWLDAAGSGRDFEDISPKEAYKAHCGKLKCRPNSQVCFTLEQFKRVGDVAAFSVEDNYLGKDGLLALLGTMAMFTNMTTVSLAGCDVQTGDLVAVTGVFRHHRSVESIDLRRNQFSSVGAKLLLEMLQWNNNISELLIDLSSNPMNDMLMCKITSHLENRVPTNSRPTTAPSPVTFSADSLPPLRPTPPKSAKGLFAARPPTVTAVSAAPEYYPRAPPIQKQVPPPSPLRENPLDISQSLDTSLIQERQRALEGELSRVKQDREDLESKYDRSLALTREELESKYDRTIASVRDQANQAEREIQATKVELREQHNSSLQNLHRQLEKERELAAEREAEMERRWQREAAAQRELLREREREKERLVLEIEKQKAAFEAAEKGRQDEERALQKQKHALELWQDEQSHSQSRELEQSRMRDQERQLLLEGELSRVKEARGAMESKYERQIALVEEKQVQKDHDMKMTWEELKQQQLTVLSLQRQLERERELATEREILLERKWAAQREQEAEEQRKLLKDRESERLLERDRIMRELDMQRASFETAEQQRQLERERELERERQRQDERAGERRRAEDAARTRERIRQEEREALMALQEDEQRRIREREAEREQWRSNERLREEQRQLQQESHHKLEMELTLQKHRLKEEDIERRAKEKANEMFAEKLNRDREIRLKLKEEEELLKQKLNEQMAKEAELQAEEQMRQKIEESQKELERKRSRRGQSAGGASVVRNRPSSGSPRPSTSAGEKKSLDHEVRTMKAEAEHKRMADTQRKILEVQIWKRSLFRCIQKIILDNRMKNSRWVRLSKALTMSRGEMKVAIVQNSLLEGEELEEALQDDKREQSEAAAEKLRNKRMKKRYGNDWATKVGKDEQAEGGEGGTEHLTEDQKKQRRAIRDFKRLQQQAEEVRKLDELQSSQTFQDKLQKRKARKQAKSDREHANAARSMLDSRLRRQEIKMGIRKLGREAISAGGAEELINELREEAEERAEEARLEALRAKRQGFS